MSPTRLSAPRPRGRCQDCKKVTAIRENGLPYRHWIPDTHPDAEWDNMVCCGTTKPSIPVLVPLITELPKVTLNGIALNVSWVRRLLERLEKTGCTCGGLPPEEAGSCPNCMIVKRARAEIRRRERAGTCQEKVPNPSSD